MAKGNAMGLWLGKKGSNVFYKIKNSNNAQKQGIRERIYDPANPRTEKQAAQRMKMLPAQRIASQLSEVITRSFEGVPYGQKSRLQFIRYALAMQGDFSPAVKNSSKVWPGRYLVSKGTLPTIGATWDDGQSWFRTSIRCGGDNLTISELSDDFLFNNQFLQEGDQITIILCYNGNGLADAEGLPLYDILSFYIDTHDSRDIDNFLQGHQILIGATDEGYFAFDSRYTENTIAGAVILSREGDSGQHLRSTEIIAIRDEYSWIFDGSFYVAARRSYENKTTNTDWPVDNDGDNSGGSGPRPTPTPPTIQAVDLGLPSGTLWGSCNLGATSPYDPGLYFTWGNTRGYTADQASSVTSDAYADSPGAALTDDIEQGGVNDAAEAILGDHWVMPTAEQFTELLDTNLVDINYTQVDGVNIFIISRKNVVDGPTVILPCAGSLNLGQTSGIGSSARYWTNGYVEENIANCLESQFEVIDISTYDRTCGLSIRPVKNQRI